MDSIKDMPPSIDNIPLAKKLSDLSKEVIYAVVNKDVRGLEVEILYSLSRDLTKQLSDLTEDF